MEKKCYPQMDGLRAAAAAAVVMIHVSAGGAGSAAQACNQLARFAVPLFILLSAFGHGAPGQNLAHPARRFLRRMKRILPPFWLWSALYLAVDTLFGRPHTAPLWDFLSGGAYMHLYFIVVLVQFELLYVPLYRAVECAPRQTLVLSALVTLSMQALLCGAQLGLFRLPALPVPYSSLFVPYLLFYTVGLWLRRRDALPASRRGGGYCTAVDIKCRCRAVYGAPLSNAGQPVAAAGFDGVRIYLGAAAVGTVQHGAADAAAGAAAERIVFCIVSFPSACDAAVERMDGAAAAGHLSAPVAELADDLCRRPADCGAGFLPAARQPDGRCAAW